VKPLITLINCFSGNPCPPDAPPYGLLYVGSAIQRAGFPVRIYDRHLDIQMDVKKFCDQLISEEYHVLGLGGVASAYKDAIQIASYIKRKKPESKIIVGGYLGSTAEQLLIHAPIDAVVRGEGEITTIELLWALLQNKPLADIPGLIYLNEGEIIKTPYRKQIDNLDEIPFPDYSLVEMEKYLIPADKAPYFRLDSRSKEYKGTLIDIKTSRGCINSCTFCYRHMKGMRHHSPEYVLKHMNYLHEKYHAVFFNISDELTISSAEWVDDFCRLKQEQNLDILFRINSARVDLVTREMLQKLKDAGMVEITYGIESGSQKMLNAMFKHTTVEQNMNALRLTYELGLQTTIPLVVGLPEENLSTIFETARFLIACPHYPNIMENEYDDTSDLRVFNPIAFPGTVLYKQGLKLKIIQNEHEYLSSLNDNVVMRTYNFTRYPNFVIKLWRYSLYFVYRSMHFIENKEFLNLFRLIGRSILSLEKILLNIRR
jgi:anaerobic magnesium-protoporphyrin IX monomethyl ester cyclase